MFRNRSGRARARILGILTWLAAATLLVVGLATRSDAALIGTYSLRLDAHVRSGAYTGIEGHFNPSIPYINPVVPPHQLPATIDPLSPLAEARDLQVTETEAAQHIVISITNQTNDAQLGAIFANPLDPAFNVEWEGIFSWTNVPAGQKIALTEIGFEQGNFANVTPPFSQVISGHGTVANPLHVLLQIAPSQFTLTGNNEIVGPLKMNLEYMTMNLPTIPEPTSLALGLLALASTVGLARRRHATSRLQPAAD